MSQKSLRHEPIVQSRPKGEKRRNNLSLWLFVGVVLALLLTVPFFLLRPRADTYTLRSYETAITQQGTLIDWVRASGNVVPKTLSENRHVEENVSTSELNKG